MITKTHNLKFYTAWLYISIIAIAAAIGMTVAFAISTPKDCPACGLAAVGLLPFWFFGLLAILINLITIPVKLKKYSHDFTKQLKTLSLLVFAASLLIPVSLILWAISTSWFTR